MKFTKLFPEHNEYFTSFPKENIVFYADYMGGLTKVIIYTICPISQGFGKAVLNPVFKS